MLQRPILSDFSLSVSIPSPREYIIKISDYMDEKLRELISSTQAENDIMFNVIKCAHNQFCATIKEMGGEFFKNANGKKIVFLTNWLFAEIIYVVSESYVVVKDISLFPAGPSGGPSGGPSKGPRPSPHRFGREKDREQPFTGLLCDGDEDLMLHLCVVGKSRMNISDKCLIMLILAQDIAGFYSRNNPPSELNTCVINEFRNIKAINAPTHDVWVTSYSLIEGIVSVARNVNDITPLAGMIDGSCFSDGSGSFVNSEKDFARPYVSKSERRFCQPLSVFPWAQGFNPSH